MNIIYENNNYNVVVAEGADEGMTDLPYLLINTMTGVHEGGHHYYPAVLEIADQLSDKIDERLAAEQPAEIVTMVK